MQGEEGDSDDDVDGILESIGYSRLHLLTKLDQDVSCTFRPIHIYSHHPVREHKAFRAILS
jgi:hypothetical protein